MPSKSERLVWTDRKSPTAYIRTPRSVVPLEMKAELKELAENTSDKMDVWKVTLSVGSDAIGLEYRTGIGHRVPSRLLPEQDIPITPRLIGVLECIASDLQTAAEMPRDTGAALEYMKKELGYENPRHALAVINALNEQYDRFVPFLARHGIAVDHIKSWTNSMDAQDGPDRGYTRVYLPEVMMEDGRKAKGYVDYMFKTAGEGKRTVDLGITSAEDKVLIARVNTFTQADGDLYDAQDSVSPQTWSQHPDAAVFMEHIQNYSNGQMNAGTTAQMNFLEQNPEFKNAGYEATKEALKKAGLDPDRGYSYGSAWLVQTISDQVMKTITTLGLRLNELHSEPQVKIAP